MSQSVESKEPSLEKIDLGTWTGVHSVIGKRIPSLAMAAGGKTRRSVVAIKIGVVAIVLAGVGFGLVQQIPRILGLPPEVAPIAADLLTHGTIAPEHIQELVKSAIGGAHVSLSGAQPNQGRVILSATKDPLPAAPSSSKETSPAKANPRENTSPSPQAAKTQATSADQPRASAREKEIPKDQVHNPYWGLSNHRPQRGKARKITAAEESTLRHMMRAKRPWQRYQAISKVNNEYLRGTDLLIAEALRDQKLWVRMKALMAQGRVGKSLRLADIRQAFGQHQGALAAHFIMRLIKKAQPEDLYVLRESLKLAEPRLRRMIMRVLGRFPNIHENQLFLVAGLYDDDPYVRAIAHRHQPNLRYEKVAEMHEKVRAALTVFADALKEEANTQRQELNKEIKEKKSPAIQPIRPAGFEGIQIQKLN